MKCERYWGPAADGHWRKEIRHTTINCEHRATPLQPPSAPPPLPHQAGPGLSSQDSRLHSVDARPQESTHRAGSHSPAAAFTSHLLLLPFSHQLLPAFLSPLLLIHETTACFGCTHFFFICYLRMLPKSSVQTFFRFSALYCCSTAQRIIHNLW